jgi:hypothetical protein
LSDNMQSMHLFKWQVKAKDRKTWSSKDPVYRLKHHRKILPKSNSQNL